MSIDKNEASRSEESKEDININEGSTNINWEELYDLEKEYIYAGLCTAFCSFLEKACILEAVFRQYNDERYIFQYICWLYQDMKVFTKPDLEKLLKLLVSYAMTDQVYQIYLQLQANTKEKKKSGDSVNAVHAFSNIGGTFADDYDEEKFVGDLFIQCMEQENWYLGRFVLSYFSGFVSKRTEDILKVIGNKLLYQYESGQQVIFLLDKLNVIQQVCTLRKADTASVLQFVTSMQKLLNQPEINSVMSKFICLSPFIDNR